jgi:hypothetical protein
MFTSIEGNNCLLFTIIFQNGGGNGGGLFRGLQPEGNNPLRVNNSDVYNPLKAITVLLYRTKQLFQKFHKISKSIKKK